MCILSPLLPSSSWSVNIYTILSLPYMCFYFLFFFCQSRKHNAEIYWGIQKWTPTYTGSEYKITAAPWPYFMELRQSWAVTSVNGLRCGEQILLFLALHSKVDSVCKELEKRNYKFSKRICRGLSLHSKSRQGLFKQHPKRSNQREKLWLQYIKVQDFCCFVEYNLSKGDRQVSEEWEY